MNRQKNKKIDRRMLRFLLHSTRHQSLWHHCPKMRVFPFSPNHGILNPFVTLVQSQSVPNGLTVCPNSLNNQLAHHSNEWDLEKCSGIGANATDDALFSPRWLEIDIFEHFLAPPQLGEPLSGPIWISVVTQHVPGLVFNWIVSPQIQCKKKNG